MQFFYHPLYSALTLPERHRFPIQKYQLLKAEIEDLGLTANHFTSPIKATPAQLSLCHNQAYINDFLNGSLNNKAIKKIGFPYSEQLVERTLLSVGASIQGSEHALKHGFSANLSGGYHHAYSDYGSGFCIFNDLAIAAAHLINTDQADTILIFDCDVHQGDGTAQITQNQSNIITCSIHCEQNFPRLKQQSDYDFAMPANTTDADYLTTLEQALEFCVRIHNPDIILYNAGADIYQKDELGLFNVSLEGVYNRDYYILNYCKMNNIPLMCALGGGYQRNVNSLINVHKQLFKAAVDLYPALV
ncbi:histone deacetylase [Pseudoalteromonas carrageenovora]|uniref:histone deacetylase family protein n=1 Tax=Pseudoalteromonas TaxID=53246 RepID=UPI0026E23ED8|nr:histone deacetylase [Pseudoalteromonas carrageenovora]MDO6636769.1 histone deacetylase [Pseudoalteromonas carrageenovora]MDO6648627.1 histone deacetylase [Pseudoalteromonas carrageenovora]